MKTDVWETVRVDGENSQHPVRKEQFLEISAFLFLIVPSMALSFFAIKQGSLGFSLSAVATILRDLSLVSLILFFLWRNRESVRSIGWHFKNFWKELLLGVILFFPFFYASAKLENVLHALGLSVPSTPLPAFLSPKGFVEILLAFFLVAVVAIAEETIFRGYLMLRFKAMMNSPLAILLSAAVFSLGHGYEGTAGLVTVGFMGLIFAIIFQWRRSLVAPVVIHFLQDFTVIVLFPLLALIH
jgi:membrane protease YdiL (CAAX protease family)